MDPSEPQKSAASRSKLWIDYGPLLVFFLTNAVFGIFAATGALIVAVAIAVAFSWKVERRVPPMTLFTGVAVLVFGGLTLWLQDETFIKVKLTIINLLLAAILFVGLLTGRPLLKALLGDALQLTDAGWRGLTLRYAVFFCVLAAVNEVVWRRVSTDTWVTFKVFGVLGLTVVFTLVQTPFLQRHLIQDEEPSGEAPS